MKTTQHPCSVCGRALSAPIFKSRGARSLTSHGQTVEARTVVRMCTTCGHVETDAVLDAAAYYAADYDIFSSDQDADLMIDAGGGTLLRTTEHQTATLLERIDLPRVARVLDYGAAKGLLLRRLLAARPDLVAHAFDVTDRWKKDWASFADAERLATFEVPTAWDGTMDLVCSSFSLEHCDDLRGAIHRIAELLRQGGTLMGWVPNAYTNGGDLLVVDHRHHFSRTSLRRLLAGAGLEVVRIDDGAHAGAWLFQARKPVGDRATLPAPDLEAVVAENAAARNIATRFSRFIAEGERLARELGDRPFAIYGAGFYGALLAGAVPSVENLACFVDRDPHRQRNPVMGRPVVAPEALPADVSRVLVGLNPAIAREAIASVSAWEGRQTEFLYP
jgi:SAM-dependent methyltransferase